jgi:hypothetical protein
VRKLALSGAAIVLACVVLAVVFAQQKRQTVPLCPSVATIESGGTFHLAGCTYVVPYGVRLTNPTVIDGGTWQDPTAAVPTTGGVKPVIDVRFTKGVTIENATVTGGNSSDGKNLALVGQAGIEFQDASGTLTNDTVSNVFGDCLELWADPPKHTTPDQVTGSLLNLTACGRDGISPVDVTNTTLTDVTIGTFHQVAIDFESDVASGLGSFTMSYSTMKGVEVSEKPLAPVTFDHDTITGGQIQFYARSQWAYPVTFSNGSFTGTTKSIPAIIMRGPGLAHFVHESLAPGGKGPLTSVQPGGTLAITP